MTGSEGGPLLHDHDGREHWHGYGNLPHEHEPHDCGYEEGTFACRIRHQHVSIGWGRAQHQR